MACAPLIADGKVIGNITFSTGVTRPIRKRRRAFWCFKCRKRQMHTLMAHFPDSPWYEPNAWWNCPQCKDDYTRFPGW
jgi:hypothetical protein